MSAPSLTPAHWQADALCRVARLDLPSVARRMRISRLAVIDLLGEVLAFQDAQRARKVPPATPPPPPCAPAAPLPAAHATGGRHGSGVMSLVLRAADGDSQPVTEPSFAGVMDAHGALAFRGARCVGGCYVLEGDGDDVGELLADEAMAYVVDLKYGGREYHGLLEIRGIRFPAAA